MPFTYAHLYFIKYAWVTADDFNDLMQKFVFSPIFRLYKPQPFLRIHTWVMSCTWNLLTIECYEFTLDLRLSCNMSAAQFNFLDLIMKSASPFLGGFTLAFGKCADFWEKPKWRTNCKYSKVLSVFNINVFHRSRISPLLNSGLMSNLEKKLFSYYFLSLVSINMIWTC